MCVMCVLSHFTNCYGNESISFRDKLRFEHNKIGAHHFYNMKALLTIVKNVCMHNGKFLNETFFKYTSLLSSRTAIIYYARSYSRGCNAKHTILISMFCITAAEQPREYKRGLRDVPQWFSLYFLQNLWFIGNGELLCESPFQSSSQAGSAV
jgi:hypothetical protein